MQEVNITPDLIRASVSTLMNQIHDCWAVPAGWWTDLKTMQPKDRNSGELLALVHSEVSEAAEEDPEAWGALATLNTVARNALLDRMATKADLLEIHHALSRALEGARKGKMDQHLPEYTVLEVELADVLIRVVDMAAGKKLRLAEATAAKASYNAQRADHKVENRKAEGGKAF